MTTPPQPPKKYLLPITIAFVAFVFGVGAVKIEQWESSGMWHTEKAFENNHGDENEFCNIALINLRGDMATYGDSSDGTVASSEFIVNAIEDAEKNEDIKGVVLQIDSTGGDPVAGEEIANALLRSTKPNVALVRSSGLSAAYWAALGANTIIASANSEVGSIGVTSSYVDQVNMNKKDGLQFNQISTGEYKDMYNPNKPLTAKEEKVIRDELNTVFQSFKHFVSERRGLTDAELAGDLTSGLGFVGTNARERKLVDMLGDKETARTYIASKLGKPLDEIILCK